MIDAGHIGTEMPPYTVEVEKGRLRFFVKAIGETNPLYSDEAAALAAGYRSLLAPPTFAFCLEMELPNPLAIYEQMGVDLRRTLHGEQKCVYYQPIFAGDRLTFRSRIADIYSRKGGTLEFIVKETRVINQDGQRVVDLTSVIVIRNGPGA